MTYNIAYVSVPLMPGNPAGLAGNEVGVALTAVVLSLFPSSWQCVAWGLEHHGNSSVSSAGTLLSIFSCQRSGLSGEENIML